MLCLSQADIYVLIYIIYEYILCYKYQLTFRAYQLSLVLHLYVNDINLCFSRVIFYVI